MKGKVAAGAGMRGGKRELEGGVLKACPARKEVKGSGGLRRSQGGGQVRPQSGDNSEMFLAVQRVRSSGKESYGGSIKIPSTS